MPGRLPAQNTQPRQPFGPQLKQALISAAPLFSAMAAGYSSGRGPYAYLDQGIAGMQAMQKQKRDEEAAAAATAAFAGLVPGGMGPAGMSTKGGTSSGGGFAPVPIDPSSPDAIAADTMTALGRGNDWLKYSNQGATRNDPLDAKLVDAMSFLPQLGITMNVISGGQEAAGEGGSRTGSTRHDHGMAADVDFYKDGRKLDWNNPDDMPILAQIVQTAKSQGVTGIGAGDDYMGAGRFHVGFGNPGVWGAGGKGANAPEWLVSAYNGAPSGSVTMSAKGEGSVPGVVDPLSDPYVQQLMGVMAMPGLTPEQQAVVQLQLQTRMGQLTAPNPDADEDRARQRRARDAELLGYGRGTPEWNQYVVTGEMPKAATPTDDMREYELAKSQGYTGTFQQYQVDLKKAGATTNNISVGGGPEMGKLSTDYGYVLDENGNPKIDPITGLPTAAPVPGSPAAIEAAQAADKARMRNEAMVKTAEIVTGKIQEARDILNQSSALNPATGFGAETAAGVGGTNAANMKAATDTIVASIAFDKLQAMRESSPTGGALGAVSDTEMGLLSAAIASLSQTQSPEQFAKHLDDVERIYGDVMKKFAAYPGAGGVSLGTAPSGGDLGLSDDDLQYLGQP